MVEAGINYMEAVLARPTKRNYTISQKAVFVEEESIPELQLFTLKNLNGRGMLRVTFLRQVWRGARNKETNEEMSAGGATN